MDFRLLLALVAAAQACPAGVIAASRVGVLTFDQSGTQLSAVKVTAPICDGKITGAVSVWGSSVMRLEVFTFTEKFLLPEWDRQALASLTITGIADDFIWVKVNGVEMTPRPAMAQSVTYDILPFVLGSSDDLGWHENVIEVFGNNTAGTKACVTYSIKYSF